MNKYIQDEIRNNLRSIIRGLSKPQYKAISEIVRGLLIVGKPILNALVQDENKSTKKQAEKYAKHLGNIELKAKIDKFALRKAISNIKPTTIIAYDLSDISKECAKKMERLTTVFDGSKRRKTTGYTLHGVGINNILVKNEIHDADCKTLNQIRSKIVRKISEKAERQGIWVFDRGNDDKQFFKELRHKIKVNFIARLKKNRQVVIKETGEKLRVENLTEGKYEVYLMNKYNTKVDTRAKFTLIISNHLEDKQPIRLISSLKIDDYSIKQFVTMYLERWGVENIFKRIKVKFELESIRLLRYQRFENLVALVQFAVVVSTIIFNKVQQATHVLMTGFLMIYKRFIKLKNLTFNLDSFISFLKSSISPLLRRKYSHPPNQLPLFSNYALEKLGVI